MIKKNYIISNLNKFKPMIKKKSYIISKLIKPFREQWNWLEVKKATQEKVITFP